MTPLEERFAIVHLNSVKDHLNDAFKEMSKVTDPLPTMHAIRLDILRALRSVDVQINKFQNNGKGKK